MRRTSKEIILRPEERRELEVFTGSGTRSIKLFKRAGIILALDTSGGRIPAKEGSSARRIRISRQTVQTGHGQPEYSCALFVSVK